MKKPYFLCYIKSTTLVDYNRTYSLNELNNFNVKFIEEIPDIKGKTLYSNDIVTYETFQKNKILRFKNIEDLLITFSFWFDNEFENTYSDDFLLKRLIEKMIK